jgi:hypothetical protein
LRPHPFYIGIALALAGLVGSWLLVHDTRSHVAKEAAGNNVPLLKNIFWDTTLFDRNLGSVTQAGLINNLNQGMAGCIRAWREKRFVALPRHATVLGNLLVRPCH